MSFHVNSTGTDVHTVIAFTYADAAARLAAVVTAADIGKGARQLDDKSIWFLASDSPLTWLPVGGSTDVAEVTALANYALTTAFTGTALAQAAYSLASIGTNVGTNALNLSYQGSNLAWEAYTIATQGTLLESQGGTIGGTLAILGWGTMTGNLVLPNVQVSVGTVPAASAQSGTIYYDFTGPAYQQTTVDRTIFVSGSNTYPGRELAIVLQAPGPAQTINFSPQFTWYGTNPPASIGSKNLLVALTSLGSNLSSVIGAISVAQ